MNEIDFAAFGAAIFAILMAGSGQPRQNLAVYSVQTLLVALAAALHAFRTGEEQLYYVAAALVIVKALAVPFFLYWLSRKIQAREDPGTILPHALGMHASIILLGLSRFLAVWLPEPPGGQHALGAATASVSLLLTGVLFMLTRRNALSQITGFLTLENGIFLFAATQTRGMPLIVEMGVLLDVLVAVMIGGLFVFRIQKSFEHIDVTRLNGLRETQEPRN